MTLRDPMGKEIPPPPNGELPGLVPPASAAFMATQPESASLVPGLAYSATQLRDMALASGATLKVLGSLHRIERFEITPTGTVSEVRDFAPAGANAFRVQRIAREFRTARTGSVMRTTTHFAAIADSIRPAAPEVLRLESLEAPTTSSPPTLPSRALRDTPRGTLRVVAEKSVQQCPDGRRPGGTSRGYEIILQHGIRSSGDTWCATEDQLHAQLEVAGTQKFTTGSLDRLHTQARRLDSARVNPSVLSAGTIVVGHSQGGLIGRHLAQEHHREIPLMGPIDSTKGAIAGVITIGTPHRGAPLVPGIVNVAAIAQEMGFVAGAVQCEPWNPDGPGGGGDPPGPQQFIGPSWTSYVACLWTAQVISQSLFRFVDVLFPPSLVGVGGTLHGSFIDLHPSSYFLESLNATYEPFKRVAIYHAIPSHFSVCRLGYEFAVDAVENGGLAAAVCEVTAMNALFHWSLLQLAGGAQHEANLYMGLLIALHAADMAYNLVIGTFGHGPGDGIVPTSSQVYPSVPGTVPPAQYTQFVGQNPSKDSHVRQTRGGVSRSLLKRALMDELQVQPR